MRDLISERGGRLITRGNLDGIACAAVFSERYPELAVRFVTSPPAAVREVLGGDAPALVADIPLTDDMVMVLDARGGAVRLVDHHPTSLRSEHAHIDMGRSAAGALHAFLGDRAAGARIAAVADVHERSESALVRSMGAEHGRDRLEREAEVLDLAWRLNVEDDAFRLDAARALAEGRWPSEVPAIVQRCEAVRRGGHWDKAVDAVNDRLEVRGGVGLLDLRGKRVSLHGFGAAALAEAARARRCGYTLLLRGSGSTATASVRAAGSGALDLGRFVEEFTHVHGIGGGGHRASAGARVPSGAADLLIDRLVAAAC